LFLIWPTNVWFRPPTPSGLRLLRLAIVIFILVSAGVGVRAIAASYREAFLKAWMTAVPPRVADQIATVDRVMRPGEALLVTYPASHPWYPRVWQRVLYPRTVVLLSRDQTTAANVARLRARYGIRFAVAMGSPPPDPGFARVRDLGPLLSANDRVLFGPLRP